MYVCQFLYKLPLPTLKLVVRRARVAPRANCTRANPRPPFYPHALSSSTRPVALVKMFESGSHDTILSFSCLYGCTCTFKRAKKGSLLCTFNFGHQQKKGWPVRDVRVSLISFELKSVIVKRGVVTGTVHSSSIPVCVCESQWQLPTTVACVYHTLTVAWTAECVLVTNRQRLTTCCQV